MTPPNDELAGLADAEVQKEAAGLAQDGFIRIFRLLAEGDEAAAELGLSVIEARARDWANKGETEEARTMRLALLVSGLDQWGLAWTQAFSLAALPGLTALLGNLRNPLDAQATARFEQQFAAIETRGFMRKAEESPSKQEFHWNRNFETYYHIGKSMGDTMVGLVQK